MLSEQNIQLYSDRQVIFAALAGTPLAGAYLMAQNAKSMGFAERARRNVIIGLILNIIELLGILLIPGFFWYIALLLFHIGIVGMLAREFQRSQGASVHAHLSSGGLRRPWWQVIVAGIATLFLSFVLLVMVTAALL